MNIRISWSVWENEADFYSTCMSNHAGLANQSLDNQGLHTIVSGRHSGNLPNFLHSLTSENKSQRGATMIDGAPSIKPGSRPGNVS
jgi:hypothetical protein